MRYEVVWIRAAEQDLAAVWLAATDQSAVTTASDRIDRELENDPLNAGESRDASVNRFVVVPPLAVWFEVVVDDRRVIVQAVSRLS